MSHCWYKICGENISVDVFVVIGHSFYLTMQKSRPFMNVVDYRLNMEFDHQSLVYLGSSVQL
jgi:hypothetical protein